MFLKTIGQSVLYEYRTSVADGRPPVASVSRGDPGPAPGAAVHCVNIL